MEGRPDTYDTSDGPQAVISNTLELFGWVKGDDAERLFYVKTKRTASVAALKLAIKKVKSVALAAFDANTLDLWKVSIPTGPDLPKKVEDLKLAEDQLLKAEDYLSEIFPGLPAEKHVHIVVGRLPAPADSGKRGHSDEESGSPMRKRARSDSEIVTPPWMHELHKALWNKPDMQEVIYRDTELTFEHFLELERRLYREFPMRDNPPDDGFPAGDLKRDFLNSNWSPSTTKRLPGGNDEKDKETDGELKTKEDDGAVLDQGETSKVKCTEDHGTNVLDDEDDDIEDRDGEDDIIHGYYLKTLFPVKAQYVDLPILDLKEFPPHCPLLIFIRSEYQVISEILDKVTRGQEGGAIVSGQPGTGKTTYLYLRLIDRLLQGKNTYFQTDDGQVFFLSDTVKPVESAEHDSQAGVEIEALVDADSRPFDVPNPMLFSSMNIRVVLTSPPRDSRTRNWLNQVGSSTGKTFIMDVWTEQEFFIAGIFFYPWDIHPDRLNEATGHFGRNSVRTWDASKSAAEMDRAKKYVREKVSQMPGTMTLIDLLGNASRASSSSSDVEMSHIAFQLQAADERRLFSMAQKTATSKWIIDMVLTEYEKGQPDASRQFYEYCKRNYI